MKVDAISLYLSYCRSLVVLAFITSAVMKVLHYSSFRDTINRLGLAGWLRKIATPAVPAAELSVASLMMLPKSLLSVGFAVALLLLVIFSLALVHGIRRGVGGSCNCFGPARHPISRVDIGRNAVLAALIGSAAMLCYRGDSPDAWVGVGTALSFSAALLSVVLIAHVQDLRFAFVELKG